MFTRIIGVIMVCLFCMVVVGCVAPADKARLVILEEKAIQYEKQAAEIAAKLADGSITLLDAEKLYTDIRSDTKLIADEIHILKNKGYSPLEIILAILERLAIIGASLGAVRISRGSVYNRKGVAPDNG